MLRLLVVTLFCLSLSGTSADAQPAEFWQFVDSSMYYSSVKYDLPKSLNFAEQARQLTHKVYGENSIWYGSTYILFSQAYYSARDFEHAARFAVEHNDRMKALLKNGGDSAVIDQYSIGLMTAATIYSHLKRTSDSEQACLECMEINRPPEHPSTNPYLGTIGKYIECERKLADVYYLNGKKAESIPYYEETFRLLKQEYAKNPIRQKEIAVEICITLNNLGYVHGDMNNYHFAELALKEACDYGEKALPTGAGYYNDALVNLATALATMNQHTEAEIYFKKAEKITRELNEDFKLGLLKANMASQLTNMATTDRIQMRLQAIDLFTKVNGIEKLPIIQEALAQDLIILGDLSKAEKYLHESSQLYFKINKTQRTGNITALWSTLAAARHKPEEALRLNAKALTEYSSQNPEYPKLFRNRSILLTRYGRITEARSAWLTTLARMNEDVKSSFSYLSEFQREQYLDNYDTYREQFLSFSAANKPNAATNGDIYDLLLKSKGMLLERVQQIKQNMAGSSDTILLDKQKRYVDMKTTLARYYQSDQNKDRLHIDSLEKEAEILEKEISRTSARTQHPERKWQQIRAALKPDEAAVEIVRFRIWDTRVNREKFWGTWDDSVNYAALILRHSSKTPQMILLPNGKALEGKHLEAYRTDIDRRTYDADSYRSFWAPLSGALTGAKTVYFSPDGVYHQISLGTLRNKTSGRFLSEEMDIQLVGSTRTLADTLKIQTQANTIALFGYPDYQKADHTQKKDALTELSYHNSPDLDRGAFDFQPLPATKEEVEAIGKIAAKQGWTSQLYTDGNASEENLKRVSSPTVLHIATHGYFLKDTSKVTLSRKALLNAGLVLAGALDSTGRDNSQRDDGLLTAYEVGQLPLKNTKLVTLSACETGLGLIRNGNGVFGLQRAFMTAGSESVLMSLWRVNDRVTKELMEKFYGYWMGGATRHEALRKAQEDIRNTSEQLSHPHYWGGFVLTER
ncbi:CHAT domain-containing tetratricopeptide repeat protein [Dyadobacter arcticus]|uniref:CHAT domain-containing tetratricopeptide repeat protein n=1 Tax=Dyadobacter arcticus TaxID=1078754 RepID=UPI001ABA87B4|nr:CHAT domain-containing protein [Dyadobacter arcticus]